MIKESEKYRKIQEIIGQNKVLQAFFQSVNQICSQFDKFVGLEQFYHSNQFKEIAKQIQNLQIPQLNQILYHLKQPQCIIALPIKVLSKYSLYLILLPTNAQFDWHNHPKMTGIQKCIHGQIQITSLDINQITEVSQGFYSYPSCKLRIQRLNHHREQKSISITSPNCYNIHKIEGKIFSAFFDLLIPDYPDNCCSYFETFEHQEEKLILKKIVQCKQTIQGWDIHTNSLLEKQKHIVLTYIIK